MICSVNLYTFAECSVLAEHIVQRARQRALVQHKRHARTARPAQKHRSSSSSHSGLPISNMCPTLTRTSGHLPRVEQHRLLGPGGGPGAEWAGQHGLLGPGRGEGPCAEQHGFLGLGGQHQHKCTQPLHRHQVINQGMCIFYYLRVWKS